jgi:hypothetical protein
MSENSGVLDQIFNAGDDALAYEFLVTLGPIPYLDAVTNSMVRCITCEIPEKSVGTYEYDFKTEHIVKPNGKNTTPKEFSMEFRVDKYFAIYKALRSWNDAIINPANGGTTFDSVNGVSSIRIPITIATGTYDTSGTFIPTLQTWSFTGCFPVGIGGFTLDNQGGDPLTCTVRWNYLKMI